MRKQFARIFRLILTFLFVAKFMVKDKKKKYFRKFTLGSFLKINYGVGLKTCDSLSALLGLNKRFRKHVRLRKNHLLLIKQEMHYMYIGAVLGKDIKGRIKNLIKLRTYRGIRHKMKLPSRGQRTHTNGKTKKKFVI